MGCASGPFHAGVHGRKVDCDIAMEGRCGIHTDRGVSN